MRAAITREPRGEISVEQVAQPERRSGQVLVDLELALLTATDWATYATGDDTLFPLVQGSGGVGILASGGGSLIVGSRVAIWPKVACGRCRFCSVGRRDACIDEATLGRDRDGTLADQVLVPRDNVVQVPSALAPEVAAAAIDYADAWHLLKEAGEPRAGWSLAVVGSAPAAHAAGRIATHKSDDVVLSESPEGLARHAPYDAIVAVGSSVDSLIDALAIEGILVVRNPSRSDAAGINASALVERRARIVGAGPAGRQDFVEVLRWIADERFLPSIAPAVPLDGVGQALDGGAQITDPVPVLLD